MSDEPKDPLTLAYNAGIVRQKLDHIADTLEKIKINATIAVHSDDEYLNSIIEHCENLECDLEECCELLDMESN